MIKENEKKGYERVTDLIVHSILKLGISGFIIYKLWNSPIKIEKFDYLYFLSTVIALFAIVLSVIFYFKSTEQSNQFYDNIFKFTKDTSNALAEMKTGLDHLEKLVYKSPNESTKENENEKIKIEKEKEQIEEKTKETDNQITKTLEDNGIPEETINKLKKELFIQSKRYAELENDKRILSEELDRLKNINQDIENNVFFYLFRSIRRNKRLTKDDVRLLTRTELRNFSNEVIEKEQGAFIKDAESQNIVRDHEITTIGLNKFRNWLLNNV